VEYYYRCAARKKILQERRGKKGPLAGPRSLGVYNSGRGEPLNNGWVKKRAMDAGCGGR